MKTKFILFSLSIAITFIAKSMEETQFLAQGGSVTKNPQTLLNEKQLPQVPVSPGTILSQDSQQRASKFFLFAEELPLYQVVSELSLFFKKNIVVYKDYKDLKISCNITDLDLEKSLDLISWLAGIEWYFRDGIYYLGGNSDFIEVLDNTNFDKSLSSVFSSSAVKILEDKIIVTGTEREVKRISDAIRKMQKRDFVTVRVWGYEVSDDVMLTLGVNIDKSLQYAFSWESLITNSYNPVQMLAVSLAMSLEARKQSDDMKLLVDTYITLISGKVQSLNVGEAIDREIYSTNEQGNVVTSGYQTTETGYMLSISAFRYNFSDFNWIMDFSLTNISEQTSNRRNQLILKNTLVLGSGPVLAGRIIKNSELLTVSKGIPFFCDIPFLGYLFRVTSERQVKRHVIFFVQRVDSDSVSVPSDSTLPLNRFPFLNISNKLNNLNNRLLK